MNVYRSLEEGGRADWRVAWRIFRFVLPHRWLVFGSVVEGMDVVDALYGGYGEMKGMPQGDKGVDVAPEPDGQEDNPYYETIECVAAGDVDNAEVLLHGKHRLRAATGNAHQVQHRRRVRLLEPLELCDDAGLAELDDLAGRAVSDPVDGRQLCEGTTPYRFAPRVDGVDGPR